MKLLISVFTLITFNNISAHELNTINLNSNLPDPSDHQIIPNGFDVGKWMLDANGNIAHWLNKKYQNKELNEPINVILCVQTESATKANDSLDKAMREAGFRPRKGHSSGYQSLINNNTYNQVAFKIKSTPDNQEIQKEKESTYSNASFLLTNNHGRIFGPVFQNNQYCYTGAFSIEARKLNHHIYGSFLKARKNLEEALVERSGARELGYAFLNNSIPEDNSLLTTGDHDGNAIIIELPNY